MKMRARIYATVVVAAGLSSTSWAEGPRTHFEGADGYYASIWRPATAFKDAAVRCGKEASESLSFNECLAMQGWRKKGTFPTPDETLEVCRVALYIVDMVGPRGEVWSLAEKMMEDFDETKRVEFTGFCMFDKGGFPVLNTGEK